MNILLVDDHPILRVAVRDLLTHNRFDLTIVAETDNMRDALALVERHQPDLVVMDIVLPGQNGIVATREIRRARPQCQVLIYTALAEPPFVVDAMAAGAAGYALKSQPIEELIAAIDDVMRGRRYLAPAMADALAKDGANGPGERGLAALSPREKEVFDLVIAGYTNRRAAATLFISERTIETHRTRINRKLGAHSTAELIRFAARHNMLST
ncbi:MAG TPA: response regulator transcription factor [Polyangia bacterium]|nr:response regulator transcription factor [Polyangia bacterium]